MHRLHTGRPLLSLLAAALAVAVVTCASPVITSQSPANAATGLIVGRVVEANGTTPIAKAIVSISGAGATSRHVVVDAGGRYMFDGLPAGAFTITATRRGYLDGAYGKLRADGTGRPLELRDGERVTDAAVTLWKFATITGTVKDDAGDPVSGAQVQVWKRTVRAGHVRLTFAGQSEYADDRGVYRIISLAPGDYAVVITSLSSTLPQALQTAAITAKNSEGAARDEFMRVTSTNGTAGFVNDLQQGFATMRVDGLLLQGSAVPTADGHHVSIYPTVRYPSAALPSQATIVTLGPGDNRTGIDLQPTLTPTVQISGTVIGPDGPMPWLSLRLVPAALDEVAAEITSSMSQSFNVAMSATDGNGAFTFLAVPPGQYIIRSLTTPRPPPEPQAPATVIHTADGMATTVANGPRLTPMVSRDPSLWTATPVSVADTDVANVAVTMVPGLRITGRVEFEGTTTKPSGAALRAIRVSVEPADGRTVWSAAGYQGQLDPNGEFYTAGLMAGSYLLKVDGVPGVWTAKSAIVSGRDIFDVPIVLRDGDVSGLVLTLTDHPTRLDGVVRDSQGRLDDSAAVIVFPADGGVIDLGASPRRLRSLRASRGGAYAITGLPPGTYNIIAVSDQQAGNWQDPAVLQKLSRSASRLVVADGQGQSFDLTTMVIR